MTPNFYVLAAGIVFLGVAVWLFIRVFKKHKKIDTCAFAYVDKVLDLGYSGGRKIYAITYHVTANEPFDLLISPCKKAYRIGKKRRLYFEKDNAKANHYFSLLKINLDRRFYSSFIFLIFAIVFIGSFIRSCLP